MPSSTLAVRGTLVHFVADPFEVGDDAATEILDDGLLVISDGVYRQVGEASDLLDTLPGDTEILNYPGDLILPGFVDTHVHYPQTEMVAAYGEQLLDWLETYTFPTERRFADADHARRSARAFLTEMLRNGTTTSLVFCTVHPVSVDVLFEEALKLDLRLIAGKVMMDRNAPEDLLDTPESGYADSLDLIRRWHDPEGTRLGYAVSPRFAPTSSPEQLDLAGQLKAEHPSVWVHTHLSENRDEIAWVRQLYPERSGYLDVYDHAGLLDRRTVLAHAVHLSDAEMGRMAETSSAIAFCPTSNLFLGSGLFRLADADAAGVRVGLGTDIGAGTSFSLLRTLEEAYKIVQLQHERLSAAKGLYLATLGGARALDLDDSIGSFAAGKEADFVVLDPASTPFLEYRMEHATSVGEQLFALMMLGDDRAVRETWVAGRPVHRRDEPGPR